MSLTQFQAVRNFHKTFGHPAPQVPTLQSEARADVRADWIVSECNELRYARTIEDQADAYGDIIYFAAGGFVELGLPYTGIFNAIHRANMRKLWPGGVVNKDATGKVIKPPGWYGPEAVIAEIIANSPRLP